MIFQTPELGEAVREAELLNWLVELGAWVKPGQPLAEVMTDKATSEIPAPFAGRIQRLLAQPGDKILIGQDLIEYQTLEELGNRAAPNVVDVIPAKETAPSASTVLIQPSATAESNVRALPAARVLAKECGLDLGSITGSGPAGQVLLRDVAARMGASNGHGSTQSSTQAAKAPKRVPGDVIPFQGLRRRIAERMELSRQTIPQACYVDECDVSELVKVKESLRDSFAKFDIRLTYLPFFVKAIALALREVPILNSSLDEKRGEIRLHKERRIGVAMATPSGLVVPAISAPDDRSLADVARELERLTHDAREDRLKMEDLQGATFTVTSLGGLGGLFFTPIINPPQVAIAGFGKIIRKPIFDQNDNIRPADFIHLSLSFDHRILDGADAANFCGTAIRWLKSPLSILSGLT